MVSRKYRPISKSRILTIALTVFVGIFVVGYFTIEYDHYLNIPELKIELSNNQNENFQNKNFPVSVMKKLSDQSREVNPAANKDQDKIILVENVPFTSQAPLAEWDDPRQQDGCEEASALMSVYWAKGLELSQKIAKDEILKISKYQENNYGNYVDTSASATASRIIMGYFRYSNVRVVNGIEIDHIINELGKGNLVIVPTDGQKLYNPFYNPPGPERHNLVIKGFDYNTNEFITNDPGTRRGEDYRYNKNILYNAIRDYPTGDHEPIKEVKKAMIVISK